MTRDVRLQVRYFFRCQTERERRSRDGRRWITYALGHGNAGVQKSRASETAPIALTLQVMGTSLSNRS